MEIKFAKIIILIVLADLTEQLPTEKIEKTFGGDGDIYTKESDRQKSSPKLVQNSDQYTEISTTPVQEVLVNENVKNFETNVKSGGPIVESSTENIPCDVSDGAYDILEIFFAKTDQFRRKKRSPEYFRPLFVYKVQNKKKIRVVRKF